MQFSGSVSGSRPQLPAFGTQAGPGVRYPTNGQEVMREGDPYATSNARSSQVPVVPAKASMQITRDLHSAQGSGFARPSTSIVQEVPHILAAPHILGTTPGSSSATQETSSSVQDASAAVGSVATSGLTSGSGSAQFGQPRHLFDHRSNNGFSMQQNARIVSLVCLLVTFPRKLLNFSQAANHSRRLSRCVNIL
jgi:hypothetical protein